MKLTTWIVLLVVLTPSSSYAIDPSPGIRPGLPSTGQKEARRKELRKLQEEARRKLTLSMAHGDQMAKLLDRWTEEYVAKDLECEELENARFYQKRLTHRWEKALCIKEQEVMEKQVLMAVDIFMKEASNVTQFSALDQAISILLDPAAAQEFRKALQQRSEEAERTPTPAVPDATAQRGSLDI